MPPKGSSEEVVLETGIYTNSPESDEMHIECRESTVKMLPTTTPKENSPERLLLGISARSEVTPDKSGDSLLMCDIRASGMNTANGNDMTSVRPLSKHQSRLHKILLMGMIFGIPSACHS